MKNHSIMASLVIGQIIKERRKELRITQPDLAELADVSLNTIYKLERGQSNPSIEILTKLADVLGMEVKLEVRNMGFLSY